MSSPFVGEIRVFGGNFAPSGWLLCNGQLLSIAENDALFNLIGTTYGGDGQTTFAVPNLQGRTLVHQGVSTTGLQYGMGESGGAENVPLSPGQLPSHGHNLSGTNVAGTSPTPGPTVAMAATSTGEAIYDNTAASKVSLATQAVSASGNGLPHDNRQPYVAVSYIISQYGIFPSRN